MSNMFIKSGIIMVVFDVWIIWVVNKIENMGEVLVSIVFVVNKVIVVKNKFLIE